MFYLSPTFKSSVSAASGAEYNYFTRYEAARLEGKPTEGNFRIGVGGCTTLIGLALTAAQSKGSLPAERRKLASSVAPDPANDEPDRLTRVEALDLLREKGFEPDRRYLIINYRGSGHKAIEGQLARAPKESFAYEKAVASYDPSLPNEEGNHPELDTGQVGVRQIGKVAETLGFIPVYMGEEPPESKDMRPNLFKYWEWKTKDGKQVRSGGRTGEAFLLRVLAEGEFDVRAVAMRSGVTDQLAFLGFPVLSIDMDTFHALPAPAIFGSKTGSEGTEKNQDVADSWARGSKLEAGLGRDYGRVFIKDERDLKRFVSEGPDSGKWSGAFADSDLDAIRDAIGFYFNDTGAGLRHKSHPLNPNKIDPMVQIFPSRALRLAGRIDTNLNTEAVVLDLKLTLTPPGIEKVPTHEAVAHAIDTVSAHAMAIRALLTWTDEDKEASNATELEKVKGGRKTTLLGMLDTAVGLCEFEYWKQTVARLRAETERVDTKKPVFEEVRH